MTSFRNRMSHVWNAGFWLPGCDGAWDIKHVSRAKLWNLGWGCYADPTEYSYTTVLYAFKNNSGSWKVKKALFWMNKHSSIPHWNRSLSVTGSKPVNKKTQMSANNHCSFENLGIKPEPQNLSAPDAENTSKCKSSDRQLTPWLVALCRPIHDRAKNHKMLLIPMYSSPLHAQMSNAQAAAGTGKQSFDFAWGGGRAFEPPSTTPHAVALHKHYVSKTECRGSRFPRFIPNQEQPIVGGQLWACFEYNTLAWAPGGDENGQAHHSTLHPRSSYLSTLDSSKD